MTTLVQLKNDYDRASNRLYRRDEVARANSAKFDELCEYDGPGRRGRETCAERGNLQLQGHGDRGVEKP